MLSFLTEGENRFNNLRVFNLVMGIFHAVQALIMLMVSNGFSIDVSTSFLKSSGLPQEGNFMISPETESVFSIQIGPAVALFLMISAAAHFIVAFSNCFTWYKRNLKKGINPARWIEYSFSASWMIVIIGMLVGILDLPSLILMFALNATMIMFGWMMELHNRTTKKTDWTAFIFGSIAGIIPWLIIVWYFVSAIKGYDPGEDGNPVPEFVYAIVIGLFLFFNIFAVNMFLQYKKIGPWKNYLFGEASYIILSLLAKSTLAWLVWSGTLRGD